MKRLAFVAAVFAVVACSKSDNANKDTATPAMAPAPAPAAAPADTSMKMDTTHKMDTTAKADTTVKTDTTVKKGGKTVKKAEHKKG